VQHLTVLYDASCSLCRRASEWLAAQEQLVALEFVPAGSGEARRRFPHLDHAQTLREVTVVADGGEVYRAEKAWVACLWALPAYRSLAERLSSPVLLPLARRFVATVSQFRPGGGGYGDGCGVDGCGADRGTQRGGTPQAAEG